jgi:hypothetical protein
MADEAATTTAGIVGLGAAAIATKVALDKLPSGISNILNTFVSSSFAMSKSAASGAASLGDMGAAVGQVASLLGPLGAAFSSVLNTAIATLEKNIATQQTLSNVGATFGGKLDLMRDTANKTYLSLDQFGKVVGDNSSILTTFGGGVQAGTETFARTQGILLAKGSETSNMMANLGIGFQEAAEMTALFMRGQGSMNKARQMSETEIAKATADYAVQLTALSDLTGQSRKALAEKAAEELAEAQYQNYLASLDPEEAKKLQAAVTQELAVTGKAGADALKAQAAGFPPMTQAARLFTATQEASVARQQELIAISKDGNIKYEDALGRFSKSLADSIPGVREDFNKIRTVLLAGGLQGGTDLSKAIEQIVRTLTATTNKTPAEIKEITDSLVASSKLSKTEATIGTDQLKQTIDNANKVLKALEPTFKSALTIGTSISEFLNNKIALPLAKKLPDIITSIESFTQQLFDKAGGMTAIEGMLDPTKLGEKITKFVNDALDLAKTATAAALGDKTAQEKLFKDMLAGWNGVMDHIKNSIPTLTNLLFENQPGAAGEGTPGAVSGAENSGGIVRQILNGIDERFFSSPPSQSAIPAAPLTGEREKGGVTTPGSYLVGERGPEIVNLGARGDVISNDNLTSMMSAVSNQNGLAESINQLNTTNGQMLSAVRELVEVSKRTLTATRGLNGNLFAA